MSFLDDVRLRRKKLADVLSDDDYSGIREIVEDLYPDKAHFIYELLQNAEDTNATKVSFELTEKMLIFEHNGRPFNEDDVLGITNIGKGSKKEQEDKIGRFGVGFKAVFAYSETPHIWSPTFSFKITELVLPSELPEKAILKGKTRFEFPFNNPKKTELAAFLEIRRGLEDLAETTLLFLSNIEVIQWRIDQKTSGEIRRVKHSINHVEVLKKDEKKTISSSHFLRFTAPVEGLPKQSLSIAFALDFLPNIKSFDQKLLLSKQLRIVPVNQGRVAVFFPAEKENSGLRFHLHAPFVPELSRASIKDTPANEPLFLQLAKLVASSLHAVRDFKMLNVDFLGVLPNKFDNIPVRYQEIRNSIFEEMNTKPLTPTYTKTHAPARNLIQAKAAIKELLSVKDIEFLVDYEDVPPRWAVGASQKYSSQDRFLSGLDINEWDFSQLLEMLQNKTSIGTSSSGPPHNITSRDVMNWLSSKSVEWHQQLYSLIYTEIHLKAEIQRNRIISSLKQLKIVRLENGDYSTAEKCFFPTNGIERDELIPLVDFRVYSFGKSKSQQEESRKILYDLGVREIGEAEQIKSILQQRYSNKCEDSENPINFNDLKRFIRFTENEPLSAKIFSEFYIFKTASNRWFLPRQVFLDSPFCETDLNAYYKVLGDEATKEALSNLYTTDIISLESFIKFAKITGVEDGLNIYETTCKSNSKKKYLYAAYGSKESSHKIDRDYFLPLLHKVIESKNIKVSRVIWRAMCRHSAGKLVAMYRKNLAGDTRYAPSLLVNWLESRAWVPQGNEEFVRPLNVSKDLLPEGFTFDKGYEWLKAIRFGEEEEQRSEEHKKKRETAKELGFSDENSLVDALWFADLDLEERQRFKEEIERKRKFVLPDDSPRNPELRGARVENQATEAPGREFEKRQRSVPIGKEDVKREADQYLSQQYTNAEGEMICQICQLPLPFKLDDGSYYFEKEEFLDGLENRHYQNYLALCPNHRAMFRHTNGSKDILTQLFQELKCNELEVVIAKKEMGIYFTATHRADLHSVLRTINSSEENKDGTGNG